MDNRKNGDIYVCFSQKNNLRKSFKYLFHGLKSIKKRLKMKRLIVTLMALMTLTIFVAPAVALPWGETEVECNADLGCQCFPIPGCEFTHSRRGSPQCAMPNEDPGVPPGPPYSQYPPGLGFPTNAGAMCLRDCLRFGHGPHPRA